MVVWRVDSAENSAPTVSREYGMVHVDPNMKLRKDYNASERTALWLRVSKNQPLVWLHTTGGDITPYGLSGSDLFRDDLLLHQTKEARNVIEIVLFYLFLFPGCLGWWLRPLRFWFLCPRVLMSLIHILDGLHNRVGRNCLRCTRCSCCQILPFTNCPINFAFDRVCKSIDFILRLWSFNYFSRVFFSSSSETPSWAQTLSCLYSCALFPCDVASCRSTFLLHPSSSSLCSARSFEGCGVCTHHHPHVRRVLHQVRLKLTLKTKPSTSGLV